MVFFFTNLSPPATVWRFTMAENKHLGGDKICPPCCWYYCCRQTAELTLEKHHSPPPPSIFPSIPLIFVLRETEEGNENEEGREKKHRIPRIQRETRGANLSFHSFTDWLSYTHSPTHSQTHIKDRE